MSKRIKDFTTTASLYTANDYLAIDGDGPRKFLVSDFFNGKGISGTAFTAGSVLFAGASGVYSQSNANLFWDNTNKRLGIGTTTPRSLLHVNMGNISTVTSVLTLSANITAVNAGLSIDFLEKDGSTAYSRVAGVVDAVGGSGELSFYTTLASILGGSTEKVRITGAGNVGIGTTSPNINAILDVTSTTKAFMPPRMTTTQRNNISSPTAGMVIYDTTLNKLAVYTTAWEAVTSA